MRQGISQKGNNHCILNTSHAEMTGAREAWHLPTISTDRTLGSLALCTACDFDALCRYPEMDCRFHSCFSSQKGGSKSNSLGFLATLQPLRLKVCSRDPFVCRLQRGTSQCQGSLRGAPVFFLSGDPTYQGTKLKTLQAKITPCDLR